MGTDVKYKCKWKKKKVWIHRAPGRFSDWSAVRSGPGARCLGRDGENLPDRACCGAPMGMGERRAPRWKGVAPAAVPAFVVQRAAEKGPAPALCRAVQTSFLIICNLLTRNVEWKQELKISYIYKLFQIVTINTAANLHLHNGPNLRIRESVQIAPVFFVQRDEITKMPKFTVDRL